MSRKKLVYVQNRHGHRANYQDVLAGVLAFEKLHGPLQRSNIIKLIRCEAALFATANSDYKRFMIIALIRVLFGLKTCGIFITSAQLLDGKTSKVWRFLFRTLKSSRHVSLLSIQPFELRPEEGQFMDDWIFDPQLWDLRYLTLQGNLGERFNSVISKVDIAKIIVSFIGRVSSRKGAKLFFELVKNAPADFQFIVAGKIDQDIFSQLDKSQCPNTVFLDFYLSDAELLEIYKKSDFIWACYDVSCDLSSGIFGRAIQLGKTPIVRSDGYLERLAKDRNFSYLSLPISEKGIGAQAAENLFRQLRIYDVGSASEQHAAVRQMAKLSLRRLKRALSV